MDSEPWLPAQHCFCSVLDEEGGREAGMGLLEVGEPGLVGGAYPGVSWGTSQLEQALGSLEH